MCLFTWNAYGVTQLFGFKSNQTFEAAAWTFRTSEQGENYRTFKIIPSISIRVKNINLNNNGYTYSL